MLKGLLTEKFKLAAHLESRTRSGYALVVDKGGPKVKEDDPNGTFMRDSHGQQLHLFGAHGHGALKGVITMAGLAGNLSRQGYGPVQDATGLIGKYDVDLTWTPDPTFAPRDPADPAATPPNADTTSPEAPIFLPRFGSR